VKKDQPKACLQTREFMHQVLDAGHQELPGEAQTHLLQCRDCQSAWKALCQFETNAFLLAAAENSERTLVAEFHDRVMYAVKHELPTYAKKLHKPGRFSVFSYAAAVIVFMLIGTWSLWFFDLSSKPTQLAENDQLTMSALSFLSLTTAKSALIALPTSYSIEDTRLKVANTVENIISPAMSVGRLIDEDFDTHLSQLMANSSENKQF